VNAIRQANPTRYGQLSVASDAFSYDIFTRVGEAIRSHPSVLGGARARRLIAVGDSQSALRLTTYVNAFPEARAYDGVIVHSRFTSGAPLNDESLIMGTTPTRIRTDAARPVLQLQTEAEVALNLVWLQPGPGPVLRIMAHVSPARNAARRTVPTRNPGGFLRRPGTPSDAVRGCGDVWSIRTPDPQDRP
jgi:hypothetical protein